MLPKAESVSARPSKLHARSQMHPNTSRLAALKRPIKAGEKVAIYIGSTHKKSLSERMLHGIGLVIVFDGGPPLRFNSMSDTRDTDNMRGAIAATLSALEWLEMNADADAEIALVSDIEYVWRHLPAHIREWIKDVKRPNHILLIDINEKLRQFNQLRFLSLSDKGVQSSLLKEAYEEADKGLKAALESEAEEIRDAALDEDWEQDPHREENHRRAIERDI